MILFAIVATILLLASVALAVIVGLDEDDFIQFVIALFLNLICSVAILVALVGIIALWEWALA